MKLLGQGWERLLAGYFDHTVTFYEPTKTQDETGQRAESYEPIEELTDLPCVVGDRTRQRTFLGATYAGETGAGPQEPRTVVLLAGLWPQIKVGFKAVVDGREFKVIERTPNQSEDVTEIPLEMWA